jgi:outer membrane biosynthesis protein TonB
VSAGTPVVGSSALLQKVLEDLDGDSTQQAMMDGMPSSSPTERRVATRSAARRRSAEVSSADSAGLSGRGTRSSARLSGGSGSSAVEGDGETTSLGVVEEAEEEGVDGLVDQLGGGQAPVQEEEADGEQEGAQEVGDKEAAQRLGRGRSRRNQPVGSPELNSGLTEGSPTLKRRRRREPASPAQQQQPAKRPRRSKSPPKPQPQPQPQPQPREKPKPKPKSGTKKQAKAKRKPPNEEDAEKGESWSVPVTVQRFTKQPRGGDEANGEDGQDAEIPFANRGGVNAVDVLSKLCEELVEAYMAKLEERARAAEDAATRREQKTMYRALEAFQEELRTRLLEHVSASIFPGLLFRFEH